ncbi:ATP-binding cassette sub-family A member 3 isoform X1, partial [Brachionus plicatilis]
SNKELLKLETYSLSQTTLEQVFLSFAREQKSDEDLLNFLRNMRCKTCPKRLQRTRLLESFKIQFDNIN